MTTAAILTKQQTKQVLSSITKNKHAVRNKVVLLLGMYAGLRAKEIAKLKRSDLFEQDGTLKTAIMLNTQQTKGSKARTIPINKKLATAIKDLDKELADKTERASLIQSQKGAAFTSNTISQLMLNIYKKANLNNHSAHSARKFFITELANNAVSIRAIQKMAGHQNLQSTQIYLDCTEQQMEAAVNTL